MQSESQYKNLIVKINDRVCLIDLAACFAGNVKDSGKKEILAYILEQTKDYKTVLGTVVWENYDPKIWLPWVLELVEQRHCLCIFDTVYKGRLPEIQKARFIDFFLLRTNFEIDVIKSSKRNTVWISDTEKFLFLTGKPNGPHRAAFLKKLIDDGLIDHCIWSLFINDDSKNSLKKFLDFTDSELQDFIERYNGSPDSVVPLSSAGTIHYGGFPYDHTLYQKASFRVISETQFESEGPWITEKTWTTIANSHPFLMAANKGALQSLESKNIRCFREYLEIPCYDEIPDSYDRVEAIITNIKTFLKNISRYHSRIQSDIDHNSRIYDTLIRENIEIIFDLCRVSGISQADLYQSGFFSDMLDITWLLFYNNVKDKTWPMCLSARHVNRLPVHIKQELIDDFEFNPKNYIQGVENGKTL